ncbi:MAG: hypothetical protein EXS06_11785 [Planctomycetaceae bacterium]|nr:hypothetical protein [Planctomycetaceae bacterium]
MINRTNSRFREAIELSVKHPFDVGSPVFDEATGALKIPPPPGFTAEEWDAELTRVVREDMQREGSRLPGEPTLNEQIKALRRSRLSPAQLADLAYFENRTAIPREAAVPAGTSMDDPRFWSKILSWLGWANCGGWFAYAIWLLVQRWRGARSK